jgi:flagellin
MAAIINTNIMSLNAQRNLNKNSMSLANSVQRLSSGLRVNSARDDASGLAQAMSFDSQVRGLTVQMRNAGDNISESQKQDAALAVATDVAQRMYELAVQSSGTYANSTLINNEFSNLGTELDSLLSDAGMSGKSWSDVSSVSKDTISGFITGSAATDIAGKRASLGATIAQQEFEIQRFEAARESYAAARSRIMDADFAAETANLTRGQILVQAGTAMVAQANQIPSNALSLL